MRFGVVGGEVMGKWQLALPLGGTLLLVGCTASETRSIVSATPSTKYRTMAVFIENSDGADRQVIERYVIAALNQEGVEAKSSSEIFEPSRKLSNQEKASLIQKNFDAVLYVIVVSKDA